MKYFLLLFTATLFLISCSDDEADKTVKQGDYPDKEYYLERDPKVNAWGAGIDFLHSETKLTETELDIKYLELDDDFPFDMDFYIVKVYYTKDNGDMAYEGCPAILLSKSTRGYKVGAGVAFFDSLTTITETMLSALEYDVAVDYSLYADSTGKFFERDGLYEAIDACIIGNDFRGTELDIPDGKTESDVQPVYLIETSEGALVKFMVVAFKPAKPNDKQTLVRWQVIKE